MAVDRHFGAVECEYDRKPLEIDLKWILCDWIQTSNLNWTPFVNVNTGNSVTNVHYSSDSMGWLVGAKFQFNVKMNEHFCLFGIVFPRHLNTCEQMYVYGLYVIWYVIWLRWCQLIWTRVSRNINAYRNEIFKSKLFWIYSTDRARAGRWWKMINDCIWVRECVWSIHFRHANYIQSKSPFFFFFFFVAEEKRKVKMTTADTDASPLFVADKCRFLRRT